MMIVTKSFLKSVLIERINIANIAKNEKPLIIAIDGRSASGKTTFANILGKEMNLPVIHTDDFFKPKASDGKLLISKYDGNFDMLRFKNEAINGMKSGFDFQIGIFDCSKGNIVENANYPKSNAYIVEGAYSLNPHLGEYADIRIFFDVEKNIQKERILHRNGYENYKSFEEIWIPAEERYFEHYNILNCCDYVAEQD